MLFSQPLYLLALPLAALLWGVLLWRERQGRQRLAALCARLTHADRAATWQSALLALGAALGLVALAGPRWGRSSEERRVRTRNVMLAVDVSRSMLAEDVRPNRLGRAKADLIDLVDALQGDRAGVLAFRGKGALLCPMTTDAAFLRQALESLSPESAPPGETDLADAIAKCLAAFEQAQSAHNAIVLISDGEDLAGRAEALAKQAGEAGVPIFTVGIGSVQGAPIPEGRGVLQYEGKSVQSKLTERTLERIAELSGGRYIPLATAGTAQTTLGAVYARYLTKLTDQEARERIETAYTERTVPFAVAAALCLLAAGALSRGRLGLKRRLALCAALCALGAGLQAQEPGRVAQKAYRQGRWQEAAEAYARARQGAEAGQQAQFAFNEALALREAGDLPGALERARLAVEDRDFTARAATLEGTLLMTQAPQATNAVARLTLREEAIRAFTRALQAEPTEAARRNLARALEGLETLRFAARRERALAAAQGQQLGAQIPTLLTRQRALAKAAPEVFALRKPEVRLAQGEQLAADVRAQADRWFPVLEALPQVVTNATLCAELLRQGEAARDALDAAAAQYEALEGDAQPLVQGEPFVYDLWKTFADPPALNAESIAVQTNALVSLSPYQPGREDEAEVLALTQRFRLLFPQWAEEQLRAQAASTNEVAFTEADRDLIARTADAIVPLLAPPVASEAKREVMEKLLLIREHLPKQGGQSPNAQSQPQQQPNEQPQQQPQDSPQEPPKQQENEAQAQEQSRKAEAEDLQALLQKAEDRNREHEKEKARLRRAATPPSARDW